MPVTRGPSKLGSEQSVTVATMTERLSTELSRRFEVDGMQLAWDSWDPGNGSVPLVLCHGFSGSADDFAWQIPVLAEDRQVLALDHRGHGRSTKAADVAAYSLPSLIADLVVWLEAVAPGPVHLLGHSMGGRIALEVALDRPDLVHSLILMDTSAGSFNPEDSAMRRMIASFLESFDPRKGLPDLTLLRGPEDDLIEAITPVELRERRDELSAAFDPYALFALGRELFGLEQRDLSGELGRINCVTTVLAGANDHPLVDQAPAFAAGIPGAELVVIDGAYHSPQLTHSAAWLAALAAHLERAE